VTHSTTVGKSVGIMSMQRIHNYGSFLQAFSLRGLIESADSSVRVEFVDFRPGEPLVSSASGVTSPVQRTLAKLSDYGRLDAGIVDRVRFINHKRRFGQHHFPLLGLSTRPNYSADVDVLVIGSDEVFNCVQSNANVGYSRDLFGHGSPAGTVISYAGSFGNTTLEKLESFGIRDQIARDLRKFSALSVRDQNSAEIVEALTERKAEIHVDPVLAYEHLIADRRIPSKRLHDDPYLIVYGYAGRLTPRENDLIRDCAGKLGVAILCLGGVQTCGDRFVDCSPFELLAYFRDASAIVTDTFHGTVFSLIYGRPFASLVRPSSDHGYGNEEKLGYLLRQFGAQEQRIDDMESLTDVLSAELDLVKIRDVLSTERRRAHAYLASSVSTHPSPP